MNNHPLDQYIENRIKEYVRNNETIIKKQDAQVIINTLMPLVDEIIADKVKQHLKFIAQYLIDSLKSKEEKPVDAKDTELSTVL